MNGFVSYLFAIPKIDVDFSILSSVSEKKMKDCHPSGSGANSRLWIFNHTLSPFYMARWFLRDDVPFRHGSHGAFFFIFVPRFFFIVKPRRHHRERFSEQVHSLHDAAQRQRFFSSWFYWFLFMGGLPTWLFKFIGRKKKNLEKVVFF